MSLKIKKILKGIVEFLFKWDFVYLKSIDGGHKFRRARFRCNRLYASPYLPDTTCELQPSGKVDGPGYVTGWKPASKRTAEHFNLTPVSERGFSLVELMIATALVGILAAFLTTQLSEKRSNSEDISSTQRNEEIHISND